MKSNLFLLGAMFLAVGCVNQLMDQPSSRTSSEDECFYASFETQDTKTTWEFDENDNLKLYWLQSDVISIFKADTHNQPYAFAGEQRSRTGNFSKVKESDFYVSVDMPTNYAVFPYDKSNAISEDGVISMTIPTVQEGIGGSANPMVAVTPTPDDYQLQFKNVCGYLFVQLYGNADIRGVTIRGNNNETISGPCRVSASSDGDPVVLTMNPPSAAITRIDDPKYKAVGNVYNRRLGATAETATAIGFALPPMTFSNGFTMTVVDQQGRVFEKSVSGPKTIERNVVSRMAPVEVVFDGPSGFAGFSDPNLKKLILSIYDVDGDGKINRSEASGVTRLGVMNDEEELVTITSWDGLDFFEDMQAINITGVRSESMDFTQFTNLRAINISNSCVGPSLNCAGLTALQALTCQGADASTLTSVDVTGCSSLRTLSLSRHPLLNSIDVSTNTALTYFAVSHCSLSSLDISNNTALDTLDCDYNQLSELELDNNTALIILRCAYNQLSELELDSNVSLTFVRCHGNQLASLDLSHNTSLITLECHDNQLTSLDVTNNVALDGLQCDNNQLTSLDLSNNANLTTLWCSGNQLTTLDISNNLALRFVYLSPMATLSTLNVRTGISIPGIYNSTTPRSTEYVPAGTSIVPIGEGPAVISFTDAAFKQTLIDDEGLDLNGDGEIDSFEAKRLTTLYYHYIPPRTVTLTFADFNYFTSLQVLEIGILNASDINLNGCDRLKTIRIYESNLTQLDVSELPSLGTLLVESSPNLATIWIHDGQDTSRFSYDSNVTTVRVKP